MWNVPDYDRAWAGEVGLEVAVDVADVGAVPGAAAPPAVGPWF